MSQVHGSSLVAAELQHPTYRLWTQVSPSQLYRPPPLKLSGDVTAAKTRIPMTINRATRPALSPNTKENIKPKNPAKKKHKIVAINPFNMPLDNDTAANIASADNIRNVFVLIWRTSA
jgi:hypothetical protein